MPYEKDIEYEKLEERVYYYNYHGDRPTQSDPGTINGVPMESLSDWDWSENTIAAYPHEGSSQ